MGVSLAEEGAPLYPWMRHSLQGMDVPHDKVTDLCLVRGRHVEAIKAEITNIFFCYVVNNN